ncbi:hypothetical protein BJF85_09135 [Saccharomonospora sp. CUA-673]|nr:hypothetical protein BJF85_09135 [Saccharomonospora sp. CUA-673]
MRAVWARPTTLTKRLARRDTRSHDLRRIGTGTSSPRSCAASTLARTRRYQTSTRQTPNSSTAMTDSSAMR